ncbi:LytR/AlgR family response regulator transcription factor [Pseudozobellia thermophila]|uniref:Two component transcriptional regulator, LytTR family n=1 Tax=Pseudozobellia thermophila TaxID=192903 RepID=A0A1M6KNE5_9FLAO|nr:LytTR family DNA-binding domain-containing protein [Pseudozobellia thermophila]SHJ60422.1 two component transcriptional regulator, LytTR family [Pseudozobellia thermophila]
MIRTLIIDDEEDSRVALSIALARFCPDVEVLALCESPLIGLKKIDELGPDLIFLDVQMPQMSGFDLLDRVEKIDFKVIFVTAFDRYAIKAIRFSALDYLLKPVDIDDLVSAVQKVKAHISLKMDNGAYQAQIRNIRYNRERLTRLAIHSDKEIILKELNEIVFMEADGGYTVIHLTDKKKITVAKTLKEYEKLLPADQFCRIHHATLVNMDHVTRYVKGDGGYVVITGGGHLDVSRRKKEHFIKLLHKF